MDENDQEFVPQRRLKRVRDNRMQGQFLNTRCFNIMSLIDFTEVVYENTTEEYPSIGSTEHLYDYAWP